MKYIEPTERTVKTAEAVARLLQYADFQLLCESLLSDLLDKQHSMLLLDGAELHRAQGAVSELKKVLESFYAAPGVTFKHISAMTAERIQQGRMVVNQETGRTSDQP